MAFSTSTVLTKPNFFIVGAPKSGTTALLSYLGEHQKVFMPQPHSMEPFHFATDLNATGGIVSRDDYLRLFARARPDHVAVGEKSVWYMYSDVAIAQIRDFEPEARLIASIRNPVDLVASLHGQFCFDMAENQPDFEAAWNLQEKRRNGLPVPPSCPHWKMLMYRDVGCMAPQIERMLGIFPRAQVKLIVFDDLIADPRAVYTDLLAFLGVPDDGRTDFPPENAARVHRWPWLAQAMVATKYGLRRAPLQPVIRPVLDALAPVKDYLRRINRIPRPRPPLRPEFREELVRTFRADVERLEEILGRRLDRWKT